MDSDSCLVCHRPLEVEPGRTGRKGVYGFCSTCNLLTQRKLPSSSELANLYTESYFKSWGGLERTDRYWNLKRSLFHSILSKARPIEPGTWSLDIGCATGACLSVFEEYGLESFGVEFNSRAAQVASKHNRNSLVVVGNIEQQIIDCDQFGLIVASDVIEHLANPEKLFQVMRGLLTLNGVVLILTPNIRSFSRRILGDHWPHFKREHLCLFSMEGLTSLSKKHGFDVEKIENFPKPISLDYLTRQLQHYKDSFIPSLLKATCTMLPASFRHKVIYIPMGEMLVLLRKVE